jgi:hypothetical protein
LLTVTLIAPESSQMRKITLFAAATAVMIATCFGVWAAAPTSARVTPSMSHQVIEPLQIMKNAKGLATAEFYDHGFVFHCEPVSKSFASNAHRRR